jgi:putative SOS response-associated peptidase YedK
MCFYYSITKKSINKLVRGKVLNENQLSLFEEHFIVNGFDHPLMPVITDELPGEIQNFQWGFLLSSANSIEKAADFLGNYNTLNAKAEDIAHSHLYAHSFLHKRCLVLCSGFFEWRQVKKEKIPYYITLKDDELFVFAGIWNKSVIKDEGTIHSFAILTIEANEIMAAIHNTKKRMPLILSPEEAKQWLNPNLSVEELNKLIKPLPSAEFIAHSIKKFIPSNSINLDTPEIIAYYNYPHIPDILSNPETLF